MLAAVAYAAGVFRIALALGNDLVRLDFIRVAKAWGGCSSPKFCRMSFNRWLRIFPCAAASPFCS
jgi:hypothetical protein